LRSAMIERATVTSLEMIGLLAWWIVILSAPVILLRRRRRREGAGHRLRRRVGCMAHAPQRDGGVVTPGGRSWMSAPSSEPSATSPSTADRGRASDQSALGRPAARASAAARSAGRSESSRLSAVRLSSEALEPLCRYVDFQRRLESEAIATSLPDPVLHRRRSVRIRNPHCDAATGARTARKPRPDRSRPSCRRRRVSAIAFAGKESSDLEGPMSARHDEPR
jgi:hypothetical protein